MGNEIIWILIGGIWTLAVIIGGILGHKSALAYLKRQHKMNQE